MSENSSSPQAETLNKAVKIGGLKVARPLPGQFALAVLAGAFIAFAANASTVASFNLLSDAASFGLGKFVSGLVFSAGLIFVVLTGAELFTGNSLLVIPLLEREIRPSDLCKNWLVVYLGNAAGAILLAALAFWSGQFLSANASLGGAVIRLASGKLGFKFFQAFCLGLLCNALVCLGVWCSFGASDVVGKVLSCFFPVVIFITAGFEHSIANLYYVPAGIFASNLGVCAMASGLSAEALQGLNWPNFLANNLLPVTLGNVVGGLTFGGVMWFAFKRPKG